jgi:hypothetical protein
MSQTTIDEFYGTLLFRPFVPAEQPRYRQLRIGEFLDHSPPRFARRQRFQRFERFPIFNFRFQKSVRIDKTHAYALEVSIGVTKEA